MKSVPKMADVHASSPTRDSSPTFQDYLNSKQFKIHTRFSNVRLLLATSLSHWTLIRIDFAPTMPMFPMVFMCMTTRVPFSFLVCMRMCMSMAMRMMSMLVTSIVNMMMMMVMMFMAMVVISRLFRRTMLAMIMIFRLFLLVVMTVAVVMFMLMRIIMSMMMMTIIMLVVMVMAMKMTIMVVMVDSMIMRCMFLMRVRFLRRQNSHSM